MQAGLKMILGLALVSLQVRGIKVPKGHCCPRDMENAMTVSRNPVIICIAYLRFCPVESRRGYVDHLYVR